MVETDLIYKIYQKFHLNGKFHGHKAPIICQSDDYCTVLLENSGMCEIFGEICEGETSTERIDFFSNLRQVVWRVSSSLKL